MNEAGHPRSTERPVDNHIIDNADDGRLLDPWWQPLVQQKGAVLITTRDGRPATWRNALVPGGRLVFDTRDPRARRWERWNPVESRDRVTLADGVEVVSWTEVTAVEGGVVTFVHHYAFSDGDERRSEATLRFRGEDEVRATLADAGFTVEHVYGGWHREPIGAPDGELLVIARRPRRPARQARIDAELDRLRK
jgi:hypothetical protein